MFDILVVGAGPAGVFAALRAAELGAKTALVTRDEFGRMPANDGPLRVRTLAHAARLFREARQLRQYGIAVHHPSFDYPQLLGRVREVVGEVGKHSVLRIDGMRAENLFRIPASFPTYTRALGAPYSTACEL